MSQPSQPITLSRPVRRSLFVVLDAESTTSKGSGQRTSVFLDETSLFNSRSVSEVSESFVNVSASSCEEPAEKLKKEVSRIRAKNLQFKEEILKQLVQFQQANSVILESGSKYSSSIGVLEEPTRRSFLTDRRNHPGLRPASHDKSQVLAIP